MMMEGKKERRDEKKNERMWDDGNYTAKLKILYFSFYTQTSILSES